MGGFWGLEDKIAMSIPYWFFYYGLRSCCDVLKLAHSLIRERSLHRPGERGFNSEVID